MKTTKTILAAAMLPLLFSCIKEEIKTNDDLNSDVFDVKINVINDNDATKASMDDVKGIFWKYNGNQYAGIVKDGKHIKSSVLKEDNIYEYEGDQQASFFFENVPEGNYYLYYPHHNEASFNRIPYWVDPNQSSGCGTSTDVFSIISKEPISLYPQSNTNYSSNGADTKFRVVGSYIRFLVYGKAGEKVKSIFIQSSDKPSGRFFVNPSTGELNGEAYDYDSETIRVNLTEDYASPATKDEAKGIYASVLPRSLKNTYTVMTDKGVYRFESSEQKAFDYGKIKDVVLNLESSKVVKSSPEALFVVGDATTAGWSAENAIPLSKVDGENKFKAENIILMVCNEGFKFLTEKGNWSNTYVNDSGNNMTFYTNLPSDKDKKFKVEKSGYYDLTVDFDTFTVTTDLKEEFPRVLSNKTETYWMIPTGNEGEFKTTAYIGYGDGNHDFYIYMGEETYHETNFVHIYSFDENNIYSGSVTKDASTNLGWYFDDGNKISQRYYDITLNTVTNKVTAKFTQGKNFWLIGEPFNGFTPDNMDNYKATADENGIATWELTTTKTGNFKICGEYNLFSRNLFWEGEWYYSNGSPFEWSWDGGNNYSTESEVKQFVVNVFGGNDKQWKLNEPGTFKIVFDTKNLKIKVYKK